MLSRRKPLAALTAVTAALAIGIPAASASGATTAPAVHTASIGVGSGLVAGSLPCQILVDQIRFAALLGNTLGENVLSNVFIYSGCGGAAI